uniref:Uncharacterized protein n=1 Tax=Anopheles maculatus TaxID=74869 RepID=A0A182TCC0_9DIPT
MTMMVEDDRMEVESMATEWFSECPVYASVRHAGGRLLQRSAPWARRIKGTEELPLPEYLWGKRIHYPAELAGIENLDTEDKERSSGGFNIPALTVALMRHALHRGLVVAEQQKD